MRHALLVVTVKVIKIGVHLHTYIVYWIKWQHKCWN